MASVQRGTACGEREKTDRESVRRLPALPLLERDLPRSWSAFMGEAERVIVSSVQARECGGSERTQPEMHAVASFPPALERAWP